MLWIISAIILLAVIIYLLPFLVYWFSRIQMSAWLDTMYKSNKNKKENGKTERK
jgi:uncharacterized membrane protein